jgi:hypothetical protein
MVFGPSIRVSDELRELHGFCLPYFESGQASSDKVNPDETKVAE